MLDFLKSFWPSKIDCDQFTEQCRQKIEEIDASFASLCDVTKTVNRQAIETTNALKARLETVQKRFECVTNDIDDLVIIKTTNKQWTVINHYACEILGVQEDKCIGKTNSEIVEIYPKLTELVQLMEIAEDAAIQTNIPKHIIALYHYRNKPIKLSIIVKTIKTNDDLVNEFVFIGHKTNIHKTTNSTLNTVN